MGEMGQQLFPPAILTTLGGWGTCRGQIEIRGFGGTLPSGLWHRWLALSRCSLHLALSPGARTQAFPCTFPVLDLALPAGKWAGDAVIEGVWNGVQGPRMPSPAAIPLIPVAPEHRA